MLRVNYWANIVWENGLGKQLQVHLVVKILGKHLHIHVVCIVTYEAYVVVGDEM